jgi:hypothetical protein
MVFSMASDLRLYNTSLCLALISTKSRTNDLGIQQSRDRIGESGRVLESQKSKVTE